MLIVDTGPGPGPGRKKEDSDEESEGEYLNRNLIMIFFAPLPSFFVFCSFFDYEK